MMSDSVITLPPSESRLFSESKLLLRLVESISRGNKGDEAAAQISACRLFQAANEITQLQGDSAQRNGGKESAKELTLAVELHNKTRNIPLTCNAELLKAYVRAAVGKIIRGFCSPSAVLKATAKSIALLAKAGSDLLSSSEPNVREDGKTCLVDAEALWKTIPENTLSKILSSTEIEDLNLTVFHMYMDLANYEQSENRDVEPSFRAAYSIIQLLPSCDLKLVFAKKVLKSATKISLSSPKEKLMLNGVVAILRLAITALDTMKSPPTEPIERTEEILRLKAIAYLTMMQVFSDLQLLDKAYNCMSQLESLLAKVRNDQKSSLRPVRDHFLLAKHSLLLTRGDTEEAGALLGGIIDKIQNFEVSLRAVMQHIESGSLTVSQMNSFFQSLKMRYPNETPSVLMAQLSSLVTHSVLENSEEIHTQTLEIVHILLKNHLNGQIPLNHAQCQQLQSIIFSRIKFLGLHSNHNLALEWIQAGESILQKSPILDDDKRGPAFLLLLKAETHYKLGSYNEAFEAATRLVEVEVSTRAVVTLFKMSLQVNPVEATIELLFDTLQKPQYREYENLARIVMCIHIADQQHSIAAVELLHQRWIQYFYDKKAWRIPTEDSTDLSLQPFNASLASVLREKMTIFLAAYLKEKVALDESSPAVKRCKVNDSMLHDVYFTEIQPSSGDAQLTCDLAIVAEKVIAPAELLLCILDGEDRLDLKALGSIDDFKWECDFLWNIVSYMCRDYKFCFAVN